MGKVVDVISGRDIGVVVKINIETAIDLSDKNAKEFFADLAGRYENGTIDVLRIWSHGATHYRDGGAYNKGNIHIGNDQIDADNIDKYKEFLAALTPKFSKNARVELRGCQAALGSGAKMMIEMAKTWGCEVQGSESSQPLLAWTGQVKSALPNVPVLAKANIVEYNDPSMKGRDH